jgi:hypothetical protein
MIRRWFILAVLCVITAIIMWDFVTKTLLYNPIADIQSTERPELEPVTAEEEFRHAWGVEIVENNLFSPQRGYTPPPPPVTKFEPEVKEVKPPPLRPNLTLNGIIFNQFGEYVAYIKVDNERTVPLREGDMVASARVLKIHERSVEVEWNGEIISLALSKIKTIKGHK